MTEGQLSKSEGRIPEGRKKTEIRSPKLCPCAGEIKVIRAGNLQHENPIALTQFGFRPFDQMPQLEFLGRPPAND